MYHFVTSATATSSRVGVIVGVCVGFSALLAVVAIIILTMICWKRISKHKHPPDIPERINGETIDMNRNIYQPAKVMTYKDLDF